MALYRRLFFLLSVLAMYIVTACAPPHPATPCLSDDDCPSGSLCEVTTSYCYRVDGGEIPMDAQGVDLVSTDRENADVVGLDREVGPADVTSPDRSDAGHALDVTTLDRSGLDVSRDVAVADLVASDGADDSAVDDGAVDDAAVDDSASADRAAVPVQIVGVLEVLPDESTQLQVVIQDPGANDTILWEMGTTDIVGLSLLEPEAETVTLAVDRQRYQEGPLPFRIGVTVEVRDPQGLKGTASVEVTILDERGPYVDAESAWRGRGYSGEEEEHGYCGAKGHPCRDLQDAMANLKDMRSQVSLPSRILIAGRSTPLIIETPLSLGVETDDDVLEIIGGHHPDTWESGSATRSVLHFTADQGVVLRHDNARLESCQVLGIASSGASFVERMAVVVDGAAATVVNNIIVGNESAVTSVASATGLHMRFPVDDTVASLYGNRIKGGFAESQSNGVYATGGAPKIILNTIQGGTAPNVYGIFINGKSGPLQPLIQSNHVIGGSGGTNTDNTQGAVGILVRGGQPQILDNDSVVGGTAGSFAIGLAVSRLAGPINIERNTITGSPDDVASRVQMAIGAMLQVDATLQGNVFRGGSGNSAYGATSGYLSQAVAFTSNSDSFIGGIADQATCGLVFHNCNDCQMVDPTIVGASGGVATNAMGMQVSGTSVHLTGGTIDTGGAVSAVYGMQTSADQVTLENVTLQAGDIAHTAGSAIGVWSTGGQLAFTGGALTVVDSETFTAGIISAADAQVLELLGTVVSVGQLLSVSDTSIGLWVRSGLLQTGQHGGVGVGLDVLGSGESKGIFLDFGTPSTEAHRLEDMLITVGDNLLGGTALYASNVESLHMVGNSLIVADTVTGRARGIVLEDSSVTSVGDTVTVGDGQLASYGVHYLSSDRHDSVDFTDLSVDAANGFTSAGLYFEQSPDDVLLHGVEARSNEGNTSVAAFFEEVVSGLTLTKCDLTAGTATGAASIGLWFRGGCESCIIGSNQMTGGDAGSGNNAGTFGLRFQPRADISAVGDPTYIFGNRITTGAAERAIGVEVGGNSGQQLRILNNNITAGGQPGGWSAGVLLGPDLDPDLGRQHPCVLVGNIIGPGEATETVNIAENGLCEDGHATVAEPYHQGALQGGRNNNLWPQGSVLLRDARLSGPNCVLTNVSDLDIINSTIPYQQDTEANDKTYSEDPRWDEGFRLNPGSPMLGASYHTGDWINFSDDTFFVDYDEQTRPMPGMSHPDIGCDET